MDKGQNILPQLAFSGPFERCLMDAVRMFQWPAKTQRAGGAAVTALSGSIDQSIGKRKPAQRHALPEWHLNPPQADEKSGVAFRLEDEQKEREAPPLRRERHSTPPDRLPRSARRGGWAGGGGGGGGQGHRYSVSCKLLWPTPVNTASLRSSLSKQRRRVFMLPPGAPERLRRPLEAASRQETPAWR